MQSQLCLRPQYVSWAVFVMSNTALSQIRRAHGASETARLQPGTEEPWQRNGPRPISESSLWRRQAEGDDYSQMISMALVCAIDGDAAIGRAAVEKAMKYVDGPIRVGHEPFATDLALCAIVYDLCYECWTDAERTRFHEYVNKTVDANVQSETHVFHNGWYGYKNWGIGLACYASYYENPQAPEILRVLEEDWRSRAAPALELAGAGGGWAEGYYVNYWLYEWLFFCEVARRCEGVDYYADAPQFFRHRAMASMFEAYPGIGDLRLAAGDPHGRRRRAGLRRRPRQDPVRPADPREPLPRRSQPSGGSRLQRDDAPVERRGVRLQGFPVAGRVRAQGRPEQLSPLAHQPRAGIRLRPQFLGRGRDVLLLQVRRPVHGPPAPRRRALPDLQARGTRRRRRALRRSSARRTT